MKAEIKATGEIVEVYHESQHGQINNIFKEAVFVNGRIWKEDELKFTQKESINRNLEEDIDSYLATYFGSKQESKGLLLKDLCARLPYGVICEFYDGERTIIKEMGIGGLHDFMFGNMEAKPYLRPMDSMTEEEGDEWAQVESDEWGINSIDWLNAHHFDYRSLIEKGLALEAPEGMYNIS